MRRMLASRDVSILSMVVLEEWKLRTYERMWTEHHRLSIYLIYLIYLFYVSGEFVPFDFPPRLALWETLGVLGPHLKSQVTSKVS